MHWTAILSFCGSAFLSTATAIETIANYNVSDMVPGAFIVEFTDNHASIPLYRALEFSANGLLGYKLFRPRPPYN